MIHIDTDNDLFIERLANGVKLTPSADHSRNNPKYALAKALQLPFNVFFSDTNYTLKKLNESCAETCGFASPTAGIGLRASDFVTRQNAELIIRCDNESILNNKIYIFEHDLHRLDGLIHSQLTIRAPWYDDNGNIIGIFGCAIAMGKHALAEALAEIGNLGLMMPAHFYQQKALLSKLKINDIYLSKRETECLRYLVRGKTARETAEIMGIAKRTVESYIENIKMKLCVSSKSELIEKVIDYF